MSEISAPSATRNPILWGAYLACSWTWCIGMFLPALLMRDMGWAGFLIFAIPNVLGAAAMGWILKSRSDSVRFVETHPTAIWWFSAVTLAFHFFWILWVSNFIWAAFSIPKSYLIGVTGGVSLFIVLSGKASRKDKSPILALLLFLFSLGVLLATFCTPDVQETNTALLTAAPKTIAPLWMLPVMCFGFLLCPYLDITFHHARQQLDSQKNGRLGFSIGFIGFFSFMILLTTRYAGVITSALEGKPFVAIATPWLAAGILTHILCQWIFTVRAHLDQIRTLPNAQSKRPLLLIVILLAGLIGSFAIRLPAHAGLTGGELIYRTFMSAYGLLFPAYILYRVIRARKNNAPVGLPAMWIAIALATPLFWMGFMERQAFWLTPGMGIIILGAFLKKKLKPLRSEK